MKDLYFLSHSALKFFLMEGVEGTLLCPCSDPEGGKNYDEWRSLDDCLSIHIILDI